MKLCKDCKHYSPRVFNDKCHIAERCTVRIPEDEPEFDPVTGREDRKIYDPRSMRREGNPCGREGNLFEERYSLLRRIFG